MTAVELQISFKCGACGVVVPVNGIASEIVCWSCDRHASLDAAAWHLLLSEPLREARALAPGVERSAMLVSESTTFQRVFRVSDPACHECRSPIAHADLVSVFAHHGRGSSTAHCPKCNHGIPLRPAPPELTAAGVIALAAESASQGRAREPVALTCTACGGGLRVDGSTRVVPCVHCNAQQYLPNDLFLSLRTAPVRAFSLLFGEPAAGVAVAPAAAPARATWLRMGDVVADPSHNLYCWGLAAPPAPPADPAARRAMLAQMMAGGGPAFALWCMAPDLTLRWRREGLPFDGVRTKLAFAPSGHIIIADHRHTEVVQCTDGATVAKLSGAPGEGGRLIVGERGHFAVDMDGTIVVLDARNDCLHRYDPTGHPIAIWGAGPAVDHSRLAEKEINGPWVHEIGKHPVRIHHALPALGGNGLLYFQSNLAFGGLCHVAAFDRSGARRDVAKCKVEGVNLERRPVIDGRGAIYIVDDQDGPCVLRLHAGQATPWLGSRARGGPLGSEHFMAGSPDGSLFLLGHGGKLRHVSPEGRVVFISEASIANDEGRTADDGALF